MSRAATVLRQLVVTLTLIVWSAAYGAPRVSPPASIVLTHNVTRNGLHVAVVNEHFEREGDGYRIVSETAAVGLAALVQPRPAVITSTGRITDAGLRPERFDGARGSRDARRVNAEFDWQNRDLHLMYDGKDEKVALLPGTQDRLSAMYQFMFLDYAGRAELAFPMTNGRKLDRYRYTIASNVEIDTPIGRLSTVHLVKQREAGDSQTEIWLAPEHRYLPVKMLIVESDGVRYEQVMTSLEIQR